MADKHIGALPQVPQLNDDSLMIVEQQGTAMKMTGAQFKEFGKQGIVQEFQDYVDAAQAAAGKASSAVKAVTDLTVEGKTLPAGQSASVAKTVRNGVFHLTFGLPRGEVGAQGPEGPAGPRGAKGDPGTGLKILGYYDTLADLETAQPNPQPGDAYGIGTKPPYPIYVFDGVDLAWKDNGTLSGGGGGLVPENVVTAEGGASLAFAEALGGGPHTVEMTAEEEAPLTADDILYGDGTVQEALEDLKSSVSDGKSLLASAITDKGVDTAQDAGFAQMAENIRQISTGSDTVDATARPGDLLAPKTAYGAAGKMEGQIPSLAAQTILPGTADKTIANGQYLAGTQTIKGDPGLVSGNIRKGVRLFGVTGAMESSFLATLTVTVDVGAVVTAKNGDTEVSALSTTGTVVLELPSEGTWAVTAVRGVAQYNTVHVTVTSHYSAKLTAEVHIVYFGEAEAFDEAVSKPAAVSAVNHALFGGGIEDGHFYSAGEAYAYDKNLTKLKAPYLLSPMGTNGNGRGNLAAARAGNYSIFAGGQCVYTSSKGTTYTDANLADCYDASLTKSMAENLNTAKYGLAGAAAGRYAVFAGGAAGHGSNIRYLSDADTYDEALTKTTPAALGAAVSALAAASNDSYAIFAGGETASGKSDLVVAYSSTLTRSVPARLSAARKGLAAARAGNYVVFAGGESSDGNMTIVEAYDLFLTRTLPPVLSAGKYFPAGTTISGIAVFAGGSFVEDGETRNVADYYDPYLVHMPLRGLGTPRRHLNAASVGDYALFGGGTGRYGDFVDVYQYI